MVKKGFLLFFLFLACIVPVSSTDTELISICGGDEELLILCFVGDEESNFLIGGDFTVPDVVLVSPANNASLAVNVEHSFEFNVTDFNSTIQNCTFVIDNVIDQSITAVVKNVTQTFNKTFVENADYYWNINCTDKLLNQNTSEIRLLTIYSPSEGIVDTGGGEQGGGAPSATVGYNMSFICQKVYEFIIVTGSDYTFGDILELQDEVFDEKTVIISIPTLTEFINNYETVCENITPSLKKEVEEEEIKVLEENGTPKDVGLLDIDIPLINKERGFDNLITGDYLYIPFTNIGLKKVLSKVLIILCFSLMIVLAVFGRSSWEVLWHPLDSIKYSMEWLALNLKRKKMYKK